MAGKNKQGFTALQLARAHTLAYTRFKFVTMSRAMFISDAESQRRLFPHFYVSNTATEVNTYRDHGLV